MTLAGCNFVVCWSLCYFHFSSSEKPSHVVFECAFSGRNCDRNLWNIHDKCKVFSHYEYACGRLSCTPDEMLCYICYTCIASRLSE